MKTLSAVVVWGILSTLLIMFLVEQDFFKGADFKNPIPKITSWYQSIEWPWTETPEEKARRIAEEFARKEQVRLNTIQRKVFVLSPGQQIRVSLGKEYKFETEDGCYRFVLFYQGQRVASGVDGPNLDTPTNDMLVDEAVFYQDPRYPYGDVVITLKTTPPK